MNWRQVSSFSSGADADEDEFGGIISASEIAQFRHRLAAGRAPRRPEIQNYDLADQLFEGQILSLDRGEAEVGSKFFAGTPRIGQHQFCSLGNRGGRIECEALFQLRDALAMLRFAQQHCPQPQVKQRVATFDLSGGAEF
jgi:hypothetical protein